MFLALAARGQAAYATWARVPVATRGERTAVVAQAKQSLPEAYEHGLTARYQPIYRPGTLSTW